MDDWIKQKEILVCGNAEATRIVDVVSALGGGLVVTEAHTKAKLLNELAKGRQPICVVEHQAPIADPTSQLTQLLAGLFGRRSTTADDRETAEAF
jgi:hypothetical protein